MTISRRKFLKISLASAVGTTLVGVGGFAYAHDIETGWIEVVHLELTLPRLSPAFDGYKLVQFSDIHIDTGKTNVHLQRVIEFANSIDHWTDPEGVRLVLRESGITDLSNSVYTVRRGDALFHLAGVDDYWERQDRLDDVLAALPGEDAAVLLAHEPDYADISAATGRFDLQISGHSHGGQVIIPFIGPLGRYQVGNMIQYTSPNAYTD